MRHFLTILIMYVTGSTLAQQVIPMDKYDNFYKRNKFRYDLLQIEKLKAEDLTDKKRSEYKAAHDSLDELEDKVFLYGFGSSDAAGKDNITANGGFSFGAQLHPAHRVFLSIGIGGKVVHSEKKDSVNITSIFFPDNASSVVYAHYEFSTGAVRRWWLYKNNKAVPMEGDRSTHDLLSFAEASFQSRNIAINDSAVNNFGITNFGLGAKYRWQYQSKDKKNRFGFDAGIGFSYIQIDEQSITNFKSIINNKLDAESLPDIFRGVNFIADVQFNDVIIYARIFSPISVNGTVSYEKQVFFSTGIKVTGEFFSF